MLPTQKEFLEWILDKIDNGSHPDDLKILINQQILKLDNYIDTEVNTILAENEKLKEELKEHNNLMMLQHKRIVEANKYWQEKLNKPKLLHSDLGSLLKFLMDRIDDLETINS